MTNNQRFMKGIEQYGAKVKVKERVRTRPERDAACTALESARVENHAAAMLFLAEEHVNIRKAIGLPGDAEPDDVVDLFENTRIERDTARAEVEKLRAEVQSLRELVAECRPVVEAVKEMRRYEKGSWDDFSRAFDKVRAVKLPAMEGGE